jgi:hypothetical protein
MKKVFGIGWARTGTTTLGTCFEILGYDHQGQDLDLVDDIATGDLTRILAQADKKQAFEDWPWIILYQELDAAFPGSRFILTTREPRKWVRSYLHILRNQGRASVKANRRRQILYGLPFPDVTEDELIDRYLRHNQEVIVYFQNRPNDLLVLDWEERAGWDALCDFLDVEVPDVPFPHANRSRYTKSMRRRLSEVTDWLRVSLHLRSF